MRPPYLAAILALIAVAAWNGGDAAVWACFALAAFLSALAGV